MQKTRHYVRSAAFAALVAAGLVTTATHVHEAGDLLLKVGISTVSPK